MEFPHTFTDSELYESYGELINPSYPLFLKRLGLKNVAVKAEGVIITDSEGKSYIDCIGGYGLFNLGHNHPAIVQALMDQLNEKQLFTKPFITKIQVRLAEYLAKTVPGGLTCSFLCNSGSEAIDNAIKLARLHKGKKQIITAENSFHGYTYGALSASGISSFKRFFEPMVPDIIHVPFGDIEALTESITSDTAAILLEPIQHEAGVTLPPEGYLREVRRICDDKDVILVLDEIKTGMGKTGRMFAYEHFGIVPDILVLGKSLGGGLMPIGALIAQKSLWKKFGLSFPMSASSFAGNVLACRSALTTIQILEQSDLINDCAKKGQWFLQELQKHVKKYPEIFKSVTGLGLLMGVETVHPQKTVELSKEMIRRGVLMVPAFGNPSVLMIEPPIIISLDDIQKVLQTFETVCARLERQHGRG